MLGDNNILAYQHTIGDYHDKPEASVGSNKVMLTLDWHHIASYATSKQKMTTSNKLPFRKHSIAMWQHFSSKIFLKGN